MRPPLTPTKPPPPSPGQSGPKGRPPEGVGAFGAFSAVLGSGLGCSPRAYRCWPRAGGGDRHTPCAQPSYRSGRTQCVPPSLQPNHPLPALAKVGQKAGRQSVFRSPGVGAVMFALLPTPWMAGASVTTTTADTDTAPAGIPNPPRYGPDLAEIRPRPHGFP